MIPSSQAALVALALAVPSGAPSEPPRFEVFPGANSRETYFTVHRVTQAHRASRGAGVKVGVLDHSFGLDAHAKLYAGSANFLGLDGERDLKSESHHGYWMALVLSEIAPEAQVFALSARRCSLRTSRSLSFEGARRRTRWMPRRRCEVSPRGLTSSRGASATTCCARAPPARCAPRRARDLAVALGSGRAASGTRGAWRRRSATCSRTR